MGAVRAIGWCIFAMVLLQMESSSCHEAAFGEFRRVGGGGGLGRRQKRPAPADGGSRGRVNEGEDEIFAAGKRAVCTGPNPLHHR